MSKSRIILVSGCAFVLASIVLAIPVLGRFGPVLDGDSILPDTLGALQSFALKDYMLVVLSAGLYLLGLCMLVAGIVLNSRK
jgi:hypothetical protein